MKNIHLLPTDKPSRLTKNNLGKLIKLNGLQHQEVNQNQNIYITNDETPKLGDYVYNTKYNNVRKYFLKVGTTTSLQAEDRKIILTTDQDLIKDGIQPIDDEFLEWFVKNSSCEFVDIYKIQQCTNCGQQNCDNGNCNGYEDKQLYLISTPTNTRKIVQMYVDGYEVAIKHVEPKQETLEEAEITFANEIKQISDYDKGRWYGRIEGAKWQQERSYSEEDLHKAYCAGSDFDISCLKGEQYYMFKEWFKQFKKK